MKTLKNNTLIYDKDCPMCGIYSSSFIKSGMLDVNGRKSFSCLNENDKQIMDLNKASNEIALIDNENKKVIYGIDSLLKIIGFSFPWIEKIGKISVIYFFLKKFYSFISYNRKVIMPNIKPIKSKDCVPSFNVKYRILYLLFAIVVTAYILNLFSEFFINYSKLNLGLIFLLFLGQIIFQILFIANKSKKVILEYLGNLTTVLLAGSLLLIPLKIVTYILNLSENTILIYFGFTVVIMFLEHFRRVKILNLTHLLSFTWILYRVIILAFILN